MWSQLQLAVCTQFRFGSSQRSFVLCSQVDRPILRYSLHKHLILPSSYSRGSFPGYFYNPSVLAPGELACCPLDKGGSGAKSKRPAHAWGKKKNTYDWTPVKCASGVAGLTAPRVRPFFAVSRGCGRTHGSGRSRAGEKPPRLMGFDSKIRRSVFL